MSVQRTFYCDAPECEHHGSSQFPGWLIVSGQGQPCKHFCNGDCLLKWAASWSMPPIEIPFPFGPDEPGDEGR